VRGISRRHRPGQSGILRQREEGPRTRASRKGDTLIPPRGDRPRDQGADHRFWFDNYAGVSFSRGCWTHDPLRTAGHLHGDGEFVRGPEVAYLPIEGDAGLDRRGVRDRKSRSDRDEGGDTITDARHPASTRCRVQGVRRCVPASTARSDSIAAADRDRQAPT